MQTTNCLTSACRYCRYYKLEGRRGGTCKQLGVPVQAHWKACSLAVSPFSPTWETLEKITSLEKSITLNYSPLETTELESTIPEEQTAIV